jgi:hypothetical protein
MINSDLLVAFEREHAEELCRHFFPAGKKVGNEWQLGDVSGARGDSLRVQLTGTKAGLWHDFATAEGGNFVKLLCASRGLTAAEAVREVELTFGVSLTINDNGSNKYQSTNSKEVSNRPKTTNTLKLGRLLECSNEDLAQLSRVRAIPIEGLRLAVERKVLWIYDNSSRGRCWLATDDARRNAIYRRLDGRPFEDGKKSLCVWQAEANWPIGIMQAASYPAIALCEGAPDFLAAFYLAWAGGIEQLVAPVCMTGAACQIHEDALLLFRGKRVRIFAHADAAGRQAAVKWAVQLGQVQAEADAFGFMGLVQADGQPVNDLNDFLLADEKKSGSKIEITTGAFDFGFERRRK